MKIQSTMVQKKFLNEEDFNISITDEHDDQDLTSIGETGKSFGIMNLMNIPNLNFSITNKNKLLNKQYDSNFNKDNYSTYTSIKKRNDAPNINDKMYTEVIYILYLNFIV